MSANQRLSREGEERERERLCVYKLVRMSSEGENEI